MCRYYCPYCSSRYQFQKTRSDGILICGHCGDPLMRKTLINSRQIFGLVALLAFLAPFIIMIVFVVQEFTKDETPNNSISLVLYTYS